MQNIRILGMLLTCPECKTVFRVEKSSINLGRKVNCGVCNNIWYALPESLQMEEITKTPEIEKKLNKNEIKPSKDITSQPPKPNKVIQKSISTSNLNQKNLIAKEIDRAKEFEIKAQKFSRFRLFYNSVFWFIFWILLFLGLIILVGYYGRLYVVSYLPQTHKVYTNFNILIKPNLQNLKITEFEAIKKNDIIIIKGKIYNSSMLKTLSPTVNITGYNEKNQLIESFDLQAENKVIESLQNNYFETKVEISKDLSGFEIKEFKADLINEVILTD